MMAVKNIRVSTLAGSGTRQVIVGRALGDRDDGQCFFAQIDLPWIVPEKWDWKKEARRRLDTYLTSQCQCKADKTNVVHCEVHRHAMSEWQCIDEAMNRASQEVATTAHISQANPGPLIKARILRHDYTWIFHDLERGGIWCKLCGAFQEPFPENPSYQNQFVFEHAKCGFPVEDYEKSIRECCLVCYGDVAKRLREKRRILMESVRDLEVILYYAEACESVRLPEKMSEEDAVKHIREQLEKGRLLSRGGS
jgi:hypothetical protein